MSDASTQSSGMQAAPEMLTHAIEPEDQARADLYALLSKLYSSAPDATLLAAIASATELGVAAQEAHSNLAANWKELIAASAATDPRSAAEEYQELFVGVGRSDVSLHGSTYARAPSGKQLLVEIREALDQLGLARQPGASMFEDHLAAVFESMRILITGQGQLPPLDVSRQCKFFQDNVESWVFACCDAICANPIANYYRRVAQFTQSFMALERDAFAME